MENLKAELDALLEQTESNLTEIGRNRLQSLLEELTSDEK